MFASSGYKKKVVLGTGSLYTCSNEYSKKEPCIHTALSGGHLIDSMCKYDTYFATYSVLRKDQILNEFIVLLLSMVSYSEKEEGTVIW